jgi:hypothetical protein
MVLASQASTAERRNNDLDIHPPHAIRTWRDIFVNLAIITVGLFVALMLEGLVNWMHHRHLVSEARANIRQEIVNNTRLADADLVELKENEVRLTKNLAQLEEIRSTHEWNKRSLDYNLNWQGFSDSAWKSARDTGALSFMAYKEVQDLADVYGLQDIANTAAVGLFEEQPKALAPLFIAKDVDQTADANLETIQARTADVLISVRDLQQMITQLEKRYQDALKKM